MDLKTLDKDQLCLKLGNKNCSHLKWWREQFFTLWKKLDAYNL